MTTRSATALLVGVLLVNAIAPRAGAAPGDLLTSFGGTVYDFALHPTSGDLYASTDTGVLVIDTSSLTLVTTLPVSSSPRGVSVSADGTRLYVATTATQRLVVIELPSLVPLAPITLPATPFDVEAGNGGRVYVTPGASGGPGIMQVDAVAGIYTGAFSEGVSVYRNGLLAISPDRNTLLFANRGLSPGTLARFDVSTAAAVKTYQNPHGFLGSNGQDLWLTPTGEYVYYPMGSGNGVLGGYDIARIRAFDMTIQGTLDTGPYPRALATSPDGVYGYAVHNSGHIDVWNTETQTQLGSYPTSGEATRLFVDRTGRHLYASFPGGLRVYEAEGTTPIVDDDEDGIDDSVDNCPGLANADQANADGDELGDPCDPFPENPDNELAACELDLGDALTELAECRARPAFEDADGDGEHDATDRCPATPPGEAIDDAGCSMGEYCRAQATPELCNRADWQNDEPIGNPGDCMPVQGRRDSTLCVPGRPGRPALRLERRPVSRQ